jgi:branched-chain amino acid transport system substrate-binding protein
VQNVKRLISEYHADLLLGPSITPNSLAVIDIAAAAKTPMISLGSADAIVTPVDAKRKWIFKTPANDEVYNAAMVNHMVKKGVKTVSVIAVDDPYGETNLRAFKRLSEPKGIRILSVEKFKRSDTSATAQALRAMQGNPDAIFIIAAGTPAATPQRALVERGYKGKIYQTGGVANADFLRVGGKDVEGTYFPAPPILVAEQLHDDYPTKREDMVFLKAYEHRFGPRSTFASSTWDALKIIEMAVPKALKSGKPGTEKFREALRNAIEETKGFKGANAVYNLSPTDHNGVNELGMAMIRIENGTWKLEDIPPFK